MARPEVGDDDVLVEIHAAGINLFDAKIADGEFKIVLPYRFPLVLGNDVAGVVVGTMVSNSCGGQRCRQVVSRGESLGGCRLPTIGSGAEVLRLRRSCTARELPKPDMMFVVPYARLDRVRQPNRGGPEVS
jgi:NADPH:quinone reductase-like Zn-dependent oxidoreductase